MSSIAINSNEYSAWTPFIHELCGVHLDLSKKYLIETRLDRLRRETECATWSEFLYKAKKTDQIKLRSRIISAITTNETSFFRDKSPFELLQQKLIPDLIDRRNRSGFKPVRMRILSTACSTGQEVYSIAMTLKELLGSFDGYAIRIDGIDISDQAVAQASYAHYTHFELERGVSPAMRYKYFESSGDRWKVKDELRALASFKKCNILQPFLNTVPYDIIFCRNVAIYFKEEDKIRLFRNIGHVLAQDGALIIGATESISGYCPEYVPMRYLRSVYYQKKQ